MWLRYVQHCGRHRSGTVLCSLFSEWLQAAVMRVCRIRAEASCSPRNEPAATSLPHAAGQAHGNSGPALQAQDVDRTLKMVFPFLDTATEVLTESILPLLEARDIVALGCVCKRLHELLLDMRNPEAEFVWKSRIKQDLRFPM